MRVCVAGVAMDFDVFLLDGRWAGLRLGGRVSPRRATFFSCSHKKRRQKKCAPLAATPQLSLRGNLGRGMGGVGRRTHFALSALRSDSCGQSVNEALALCGANATPPSPRPRRIQKGGGSPYGPLLRSALGSPHPCPLPKGEGGMPGWADGRLPLPLPVPSPSPSLPLPLPLGLGLGRRLVLVLV